LTALAPGSVIGVLGSGQLGRMLAFAAVRMGYRIHTFSPDRDSPAGQVATREIVGRYEDLAAITGFAREVDVITLEFENIPVEAIRAAEALRPVRPGAEVLHIAQNRLREKQYLQKNGFAVAPFFPVVSPADLAPAAAAVGFPAVLKTAGFGYDGKGQRRVTTAIELERAYRETGEGDRVLEGWVDFEREISVVGARGVSGEFRHWGAIENAHANHILDWSLAPARVPPTVAAEAAALTERVMSTLGAIGVLCVEFFLTRSGKLLINEIAPRPHNSGHLTIEGAATSQFEQQLRAVCGLPLGATDWKQPAAMVNLLGDVWKAGEPRWEQALAVPGVSLHHYGKREARAGRKMGHLTAVAPTWQDALDRAVRARDRLRR
jgi:5-(carboxyamino)imidazole ribonucleotide synthase